MTTTPPMTPRGNGDDVRTPERISEFNVIAGKYYIFEYMEDSQRRAVILVAGYPRSNKFFTPGVVDPSLINAEEVIDHENETTTQMDVPVEDVNSMTMIKKSFETLEDARRYLDIQTQTLTRGGNNKNKNKNKNKNRSKMTKKSKKGKKSMKNRTRKNKSRKNKSRKGK